MTICRMVVKDLLLNTVLTAKHHLGLLLFLSHRKEQTNDVTVYYNKRLTVIYAISFLEAIHFVRFLMHTKEEKCIEIQMKFAGVSCRI